MNLELRELVKAGATDLQIDEPYYSGFPEDLGWGIRAINVLVDGVEATIRLHICYGNRYGKPSWEGSYRYLFPAIRKARIDQLMLEFGRRGEEDVELFKEFDPPFGLGLGVIDVKTHDFESPAIVAERIRKALEIVPADRLGSTLTVAACTAPRRRLRQALRHGGRRGIVRKETRVSNPRRRSPGASVTSSSYRHGRREAQPSRPPGGWRACPTSWREAHDYAGGPWATTFCGFGTARGRPTPNIHLTCQ
jgi:hypothetical protein